MESNAPGECGQLSPSCRLTVFISGSLNRDSWGWGGGSVSRALLSQLRGPEQRSTGFVKKAGLTPIIYIIL